MSMERTDKEDVVHIYNATLLSHKNNEIIPFGATWIDLGILILIEVRDKYHIIFIILICGILKNGTNEPISKTEVKSQR